MKLGGQSSCKSSMSNTVVWAECEALSAVIILDSPSVCVGGALLPKRHTR